MGVYRIHSVCSFVCPSVCSSFWKICALNFILVWRWLTIFSTWVYHNETVCHVHSWSQYDVALWPQGPINRVFDVFSCLAHNCFFIWHRHSIFGTWVYYHKRTCCVDMMLTIDLMALCKGHSFLSFDIVVLYLACECIIIVWGVMYIHNLYDLELWHQYRNYIFTMNLSLEKLSLLFGIGIPNFDIRVYYYETTCVHFLTFVWPSPLTYMWGRGGSLMSFTHSFYLVVINLQEGV